jgi:hypothetical protein
MDLGLQFVDDGFAEGRREEAAHDNCDRRLSGQKSACRIDINRLAGGVKSPLLQTNALVKSPTL